MLKTGAVPPNPAARCQGKGTPRFVPPLRVAPTVRAPAPVVPAARAPAPTAAAAVQVPRPQLAAAKGASHQEPPAEAPVKEADAKAAITPQAPQLGSSVLLPLDAFSMTELSWWRDEQPKMREKFREAFVTEYGQSILGGIKARAQNAVDWAWQRDDEGLVVGDDGRSSVLALWDIRDKLTAGTLDRADCCRPVLQAIDDGIWVTPVYYGTTDALHSVAWNTMAHSEDNVKFLSSTVVDHIDLVVRLARGFDPETKWEDAQRYLCALLGPSRRRDVGRWVKIAKCMPPSVIDFLRARVQSRGMNHAVKSTCFVDNPFIVAPVARDTQLPEDMLMTAVQAMYESVDQGISVTADNFQNNYCQPALAVSKFRQKVTKKFRLWGADADPASSWQKLAHSLVRDDALRSQVAGCMQNGTSLETILAVKNAVHVFRKARDEEKARTKAETESKVQQIREEADKIREQAEDAVRAREVRR